MYVDCIYDKQKNKILVVERENRQRRMVEYPADYVFYYSHVQGSHKSIFGDQCRKYSCNNADKFRKELGKISTSISNRQAVKIFESDIRPEFRCLADRYKNASAPELNVGFFDIESDFSPEKGFAPANDPFNAITAISLHTSYDDQLVTLVLCPPTINFDHGQSICNEFKNTYLFDDERELLKVFLELIEDVDVLSGWNSSLYDIPYIVNRITKILGEDYTRQLCLWNQKPRPRKQKMFKKEHETFDLVGRVHLDYLDLYKKHNTQQLHSYRLDFVAEIEVGENKTPYEGSLDDLYKKDFNKFIEYNRQDTMLLVKIDAKKKFIDLANQIAHVNCVTLKTTMGTVALVEQAITNEMHAMGYVVPNRKKEIEDEEEEDVPVVGAYVADPKKGMHEEVGCVDINSLYPSTIRALNMSPETIFGQIRADETMALIAEKIKKLGKAKRAEAWNGIFCILEIDHVLNKDDTSLTIDFENGPTLTMTGKELYEYIFNPKNNLCMSANGTIFKTDKDGIIPLLLAKWYKERQEQQEIARNFSSLLDGIQIDEDLVNELSKYL